MAKEGWQRLLAAASGARRAGDTRIMAYSEFMPPPRIGWKPYGGTELTPFADDDLFGWQVTEYEEAVELQPGLAHVAEHVIGALVHLGHGRPVQGITKAKLEGNPYWPPELAEWALRKGIDHERYVAMLPLALSRTQDDKGRVRWTLFGGSEQGPERAFWRSFYSAPKRELSADVALEFVRRLLRAAYGETIERLADLGRAGFRILPTGGHAPLELWRERALPSWTAPYVWRQGEPVDRVKYLLTFRPFAQLPKPVRRAYLAGQLHLIPFPGSLLFWGAMPYLRMAGQLPLAVQIPLLPLCDRQEAPRGLRIPQSGWLHEHHPQEPVFDPRHGTLRNTYLRTHRWQRVHRHEDVLAVVQGEDRLAHVLFSAEPEDIGLYGKPMARNAQLWTHHYELLLDGPLAGRAELEKAAAALREGGHFGYRFLFPAMRVREHEVYWHRPLIAYLPPEATVPQVLAGAPTGYLTAYHAERPRLERPVELWPRLLDREPLRQAVRGFAAAHEHHLHQAAINVRKLLFVWQLCGHRPLPRSFARHLLTLPKAESLEDWLGSLERQEDPEEGRRLAGQVRERLEALTPGGMVTDGWHGYLARASGEHWRDASATRPSHAHGDVGMAPVRVARGGRRLPKPLTYHRTAKRSFEVAYWNTIARLAHGEYVNKDNADCVDDPATRPLLRHHHRDLEALGDYLLDYYRQTIDRHRMTGKALAGDLPFAWRTDFDFPWSGGWRNNQKGKTEERDLLVVIPGRDRRRAVVMADHYDTAYMEDCFEKGRGGNGARLAAAGADDNHSATAALMLAAPIFLELSRAGRLGCDVWLVHLTGEEFPSDCMGARHLAGCLLERSLKLRLPGRRPVDLSGTKVEGVYVLDMIAHNRDHDHDVFQISPGTSRESMGLAFQAHVANMIWNSSVPAWNRRTARRGRGRGCRTAAGGTGILPVQRSNTGETPVPLPEIAAHLPLHGEIRPPGDPRSSLYNTDGQIFSDAGVPVVLFMENYDINREGYHDTHDTMANIDLDYGAALAAVTIESVARAATERPGTPW